MKNTVGEMARMQAADRGLPSRVAKPPEQERPPAPHSRKQAEGHPKDPFPLGHPPLGLQGRDQDRHGHGKPRRGDDAEKGVQLVGGIEVAHALGTQQVQKGDAIEESDDLDGQGGKGENTRSRQEGGALGG